MSEDIISVLVAGAYTRTAIELQLDEQPPAVGPHEIPPPEGYRWETGAELRDRISRAIWQDIQKP